MAREAAIFLYLFYIRVFFSLFKLIPLKKKTVFISSFGDNVHYTSQEVLEQTDHVVIILKLSGTQGDFIENERTTIIPFSLTPFSLSFIKGLYHLATSKVVFVDNYFGILSATHFKKQVSCIQLWHANGAVKQFGLKDPSIHFRSNRAYNRFRSVYERFDHIVVGSEKMGSIFQDAFGLSSERMLTTGVPRTDLFFNEANQKEIKELILQQYPSIKGKKVILYAPTYREHQLKRHSIKLNINKLYEELSDDYVFLLRLHPAIENKYSDHYKGFIINVSDYPYLNHLLLVTDYLVTDYSSIPFEFSIMERPMIFYPYDIEEYVTERGFWEDYEELVPGPIANNTDDIIELVQQRDFGIGKIKVFADEWNEYNDGRATEKLVKYVYQIKKTESF
ncbi:MULTISPECIES: CDP-glycerol glycerophosphotransferase family protein [Allobacillus]|uniref:CDP-glycerol glycerophosphotransferase family protein n=1 Tax=Allobacillus salarius TaxID=1955272 RepID=A0A556PMP9_9BACI|nr:CDP-glycerol glycerophosphotransferase family protein [Allobacillus salarius]TSJ65664.1 CDP-glycerol glycerophosphotransferase family protein [Allobacillus salarius]